MLPFNAAYNSNPNKLVWLRNSVFNNKNDELLFDTGLETTLGI